MGELVGIALECAPLLMLLGVVLLDVHRQSEHRRRFDAAEKRRELLEHEAERLADGLPPHERCLCPKCRAWRTNPRNAELLRLRGVR